MRQGVVWGRRGAHHFKFFGRAPAGISRVGCYALTARGISHLAGIRDAPSRSAPVIFLALFATPRRNVVTDSYLPVTGIRPRGGMIYTDYFHGEN
jgi:hypothetical protein